jgi:hypothetical protein
MKTKINDEKYRNFHYFQTGQDCYYNEKLKNKMVKKSKYGNYTYVPYGHHLFLLDNEIDRVYERIEHDLRLNLPSKIRGVSTKREK